MSRPGARFARVAGSLILQCLIAFLLSLPSRAEWISKYLIHTWETEQGLPQNSVTSIAQTADGYLWFGTFGGLARFDGLQISRFNRADSPLATAAIHALHGDKQGRLWILTVDGQLFLFKDNQLAAASFESGAKPLYFGTQSVVEVGGAIFACSTKGLAQWDGAKFKIVAPGEFKIAASSHRLWAAHDATISLLSGERLVPKFNFESRGANTNKILFLAPGAGDSLLVHFSSNAVAHTAHFQFDAQSGEIRPERRPFIGEIWCVTEVGDGTILAGSNGFGLAVFPADAPGHNVTTRDGLSHSQIRSIFEDREGNLWLGSDGGGAMRLKPRFMRVFGKTSGVADEIVYSVVASRGEIILSTYSSGLFRLNALDGAAARLPLPYGHTRALLADRSESIWAGVLGEGIFHQRGAAWDRIRLPGPPQKQTALALLEDASGAMWIGGEFGLAIRQKETADPIELGPSSVVVKSLAQTRDRTIWAATREHGLFAIRDGVPRQYTTKDGLPSDQINAVMASDDGSLWIATENGLARFANSQFARWTEAQGLPASSITSVAGDLYGHLWLGSTRGIFRVSLSELAAAARDPGHFIRSAAFGLGEGLRTIECSTGAQPSACRGPDGRIWFCTIKGLAVIDPAALSPTPPAPPVQIEEIRVDQQLAFSNDPAFSKNFSDAPPRIVLPASYRVVEFRFAGLSLRSPEHVHFRHRIEGFDKDWTMAANKPLALYPKLPAGKHTFQIAAALQDGPWSPQTALVDFEVLPFWWETNAFRWSMAAAVFAAFGAAYSWNTARHRRKLQETIARQQSISAERSRISRDMHDGLGSKLTQVSLLSKTLEQPALGQPSARETAARIANISQDILQSMSEAVWAVDPRHDNLESLIERMIAFAQEHLGLAAIQCKLDVPLDVPPIDLPPAWRHHLLMFFKESIQNVVKHSKAKKASFRVELLPAAIRVEISDDGLGFDPSGTPLGNGLKNMRARAAELGGELSVDSKAATGTTLRLVAPLPEAKKVR